MITLNPLAFPNHLVVITMRLVGPSSSPLQEGRRGLVNAGAIPVLCRLSGDHERVAEPAISTLINICADELPGVSR